MIGPPKSKGMIFGPIPNVLPTLVVGDKHFEFVNESKYVRVMFKSTHQFVFACYYIEKASKAHNMVFATCAVESKVRTVPPCEGVQLYKVRIDPHLTFACEVAIDVDGSFLALLEDVQVLFLHRLLGLHKRSMCAVLFTETRIMPNTYHCIVLALWYLQYFLNYLHITMPVPLLMMPASCMWRESLPGWGILSLYSPTFQSLLCQNLSTLSTLTQFQV